jgi:hypothetical protein
VCKPTVIVKIQVFRVIACTESTVFVIQGTRMEERLDDAINVLRNHAESQLGLHAIAASSAAAVAAAAAANLQSHSNGLLGSYHHTTQSTLDSHLVSKLTADLFDIAFICETLSVSFRKWVKWKEDIVRLYRYGLWSRCSRFQMGVQWSFSVNSVMSFLHP